MATKLDFFQSQKEPTSASGILREHLSEADKASIRLDRKDKNALVAWKYSHDLKNTYP